MPTLSSGFPAPLWLHRPSTQAPWMSWASAQDCVECLAVHPALDCCCILGSTQYKRQLLAGGLISSPPPALLLRLNPGDPPAFVTTSTRAPAQLIGKTAQAPGQLSAGSHQQREAAQGLWACPCNVPFCLGTSGVPAPTTTCFLAACHVELSRKGGAPLKGPCSACRRSQFHPWHSR